MAITAAEKYKGRSGTGKTRQIVYLVRGTDDEELAIAAPADLAVAPSLWNGLIRDDDATSIDQLGDELWEVTVPYNEPGEPEIGEASFEFSFQAPSEHIQQSLETVGSYGTSPPDFGGAIGVRYDNGRPVIQGVQLPTPTETFGYGFSIDPADIDQTYILGIGDMCERGVKSSDAFTYQGKTYPAETLRLVSVRGSIRTSDRFHIRFGLSYQKNATGLAIGGISGIAKKGHNLLWFLYEDDEDSTRLIKKPTACYQERVFEKSSFGVLGFGTVA